MNTFIALLRGVNVGGKNSLPMKALVRLLSSEGYQNVCTYIQSGNIVFDSNAPSEDQLTALIEKSFGFKPETLILTRKEFRNAAENNPYNEVEGKFCHFYFSRKSLEKADTGRLLDLKDGSERFKIIGRVLYLHAPNGVGKSKFAARIEHCLNVPVTARNLNTVNKLLSMSS